MPLKNSGIAKGGKHNS